MPNEINLNQGQVLINDEIREYFKCGLQGGMRRSLKTNSLILISDHIRGIYKDRWEDRILHYTGMGLRGDQSLNFAQNKTLSESDKSRVNLFLFEVFESGKYTFILILVMKKLIKLNGMSKNSNNSKKKINLCSNIY